MERSYLFVPGTNAVMIKKAISTNADCVIIDLEDAVAFTEKENARENIKIALLQDSHTKKIIIRINDLDSPYWEEDVMCAITSGAKGVMIPKSESSECIREVCNKIRRLVIEKGIAFEVIPLIETAKGVQNAYTVASADPMISRLAFGSIDFALDIDCDLTPNGLELLYARSRVVIASRAASINSPIDAVYPDLNNEKGLEYEAVFSKQIGFKAKLLIHPKQIETVHSVFSPSEKEINKALEIVRAFEEAERNGIASIKVNNTLVDYPVYKKAKGILTLSTK